MTGSDAVRDSIYVDLWAADDTVPVRCGAVDTGQLRIERSALPSSLGEVQRIVVHRTREESLIPNADLVGGWIRLDMATQPIARTEGDANDP